MEMSSSTDCLDTSDTMKFNASFAESKLSWIRQHKHVGETSKAITKIVSTVMGGHLYECTHTSVTTGKLMEFQVFTPPVSQLGSVPQLYVLCNAEVASMDFAKMFDQAASWGIAVIIVASESADLISDDGCNSSSKSAGGEGLLGCVDVWYVDRGDQPVSCGSEKDMCNSLGAPGDERHAGETDKHEHHMYSYVVDELRAVVTANFPVRHDCMSLMGYKSGGHGAFLISLRRPEEFRSVSAITPLCVLPSDILEELGDTAARWDLPQFVQSKLCPSSEVLKYPLFADLLNATADNVALQDHYLSTECCLEMARVLAKRGIQMEFSKHAVADYPTGEEIGLWFGMHVQHHAEYLCPAKFAERSAAAATAGAAVQL